MAIVNIVRSTARSLRSRVMNRPNKAQSPFGGFRKRTMTARQLAGSAASLAPEVGAIYRIWARHAIDPGFREELMLAVSRLNDCRFCTWGHQEWAQMNGISDDELARIEQLDPSGFDRRKWLAITYVRALVEGNFRRVTPELRRAMQHKYSPREIRDIELIARVMDIGNRGSNTFDAMRSRLRGVPAADSRVVDEMILSSVFLATAPVVVLFLSRASKRPFLEMARSLIDYTRHREEAAAAGKNAQ